MCMNNIQLDIYSGHQQINPSATQAIQNNYFGQIQAGPLPAADTVVVLGAGVDAANGFPVTSQIIPGIVEWLETDEGKAIDEALRRQIKHLSFRFDRFVDNAIDRLVKDLDRERETICRNVSAELAHNIHLEEGHRKMGDLIVRIFQKISDVKKGAAIDADTERLIREVTGIEPVEDTIIDFSRLNYTDTFKNIIVHILRKSMYDVSNPILRHVYKNLLDIEQLLAQYFYGFFTGKSGMVKTYLYISWMLWAYLVHEEHQVFHHRQSPTLFAEETVPSGPRPVYDQLAGVSNCQVITFNYTTLASRIAPGALHFNGILSDYVDIENKNDLCIEDLSTLDLQWFFQQRLPQEMSLEGDRIAIPVPSFMPPLKLKPVISSRYISTWYHSSESIRRAKRILVLGHDLQSSDHFFGDILRSSKESEMIWVDSDMDTMSHQLCQLLQLPYNRYTQITIDGHPARRYDNRITLVQADLKELNLSPWLEKS